MGFRAARGWRSRSPLRMRVTALREETTCYFPREMQGGVEPIRNLTRERISPGREKRRETSYNYCSWGRNSRLPHRNYRRYISANNNCRYSGSTSPTTSEYVKRMLPLLLQSAEISPTRRSRTAETHINKLRGSEKKDEITLSSLPPLLPRIIRNSKQIPLRGGSSGSRIKFSQVHRATYSARKETTYTDESVSFFLSLFFFFLSSFLVHPELVRERERKRDGIFDYLDRKLR